MIEERSLILIESYFKVVSDMRDDITRVDVKVKNPGEKREIVCVEVVWKGGYIVADYTAETDLLAIMYDLELKIYKEITTKLKADIVISQMIKPEVVENV